jgi:hypothetical protein
MAAITSPPPFHVQAFIDNPNSFPHHQSISALWETKWRETCSQGEYPFQDGKLEDFGPLFEQLKVSSKDRNAIFNQPDEYAKNFLPAGNKLFEDGQVAEAKGDTVAAKELFLRAADIFCVAKFPIDRSPLTEQAWQQCKAAYFKASQYMESRNIEVMIPFKHADTTAGDKAKDIPVWIRLPNATKPAGGWPTILFICGLDVYRTDQANRTDPHLANGFATLCVEILRTGDRPAARRDPASGDRLWKSILDWIETEGAQKYGLNANRVVTRGISTGSGDAIRLAHTYLDRLFAAVGQGGWTHHMVSPQWFRNIDHVSYLFSGAEALAYKFGYESIDSFLASNPQKRLSLLENRTLDKPCCMSLLANGMEDSAFPIEDSILVALRGRPKDIRILEGRGHMGRPGGEEIVYDWINQVVHGKETEAKTCPKEAF